MWAEFPNLRQNLSIEVTSFPYYSYRSIMSLIAL